MSKLKILCLCGKKHYETKLSRWIFHSMDALSKIADVVISGPGWSNYNNSLSVNNNIKQIYKNSYPDFIVVYKPLEMKSFRRVSCPVCIRYNEMITNDKLTNYGMIEIAKEITYSKANLLICHHLNDLLYWKNLLKNRISKSFELINIPLSAEKTIFKDYRLKKRWDMLLIGKLGESYPFRFRLKKILKKMSKKWQCNVWTHPGYDVSNAHNNLSLIKFAKAINSAKICCTCSSKQKYRLAKYIEVPMCGTALAADLPDENHYFFRQFLIELDMSMSDKEIIDKLEYYLTHENERKRLVKKGLKLSKNYTQEDYAKRFINLTERFLKGYRSRSKYDQFVWFFKKRFTNYTILKSNFIASLNNSPAFLDKFFGKVGIFLKKYFPSLYSFLKNKNEKRK